MGYMLRLYFASLIIALCISCVAIVGWVMMEIKAGDVCKRPGCCDMYRMIWGGWSAPPMTDRKGTLYRLN